MARRSRPRRVPLYAPGVELTPGDVASATTSIAGRTYDRIVVCTEWVAEGDDLGDLLDRHLAPLLRTGDMVALSEKVVVVATGRAVPRAQVRVGRLARAVAGCVRPIGDSRGLSIPEKVQLVIDRVGAVRVVAAVVASALTRPIGIRGAFYVVAGPFARGIDGLRPPYTDVLLPPLTPDEARREAVTLADRLGHPVAVVDINDRGGEVRAASPGHLPRALLADVLADNPMGQRAQATPIVLIRAS